MTKRYYWFKMKRDFFEDPKIRKLMIRGDVGEHAVILYERLLLHAIRNDGHVALDAENPAADLCYMFADSPERLAPALDLLISVGLASMEKDGLYLPGVEDYVGSETESARIKRRQRAKKKGENGQVDNVHTEKEKEKEKEKDSDPHTETESSADAAAATMPLKDGKTYFVTKKDAEDYRALYPELDVEKELRHMKSWLTNNPKKRRKAGEMGRFITGWLNRASETGNQKQNTASAAPVRPNPERSYNLEEAQRRMETTVPKLKKKAA